MELQVVEQPTTVQIVETTGTSVHITEISRVVSETPDLSVVVVDESTVYQVAITEPSIAIVEVLRTQIVAIHEGVLIRHDVQLASSIVNYPAGVSIGGHRAVFLDNDGKAYYADNTVLDHNGKVLGITTGSAAQDDDASIQTFGVLTEPSWTWVAGLTIFLGQNGVLTQSAPASGFYLTLGFAITPISIFINIKVPIIL